MASACSFVRQLIIVHCAVDSGLLAATRGVYAWHVASLQGAKPLTTRGMEEGGTVGCHPPSGSGVLRCSDVSGAFWCPICPRAPKHQNIRTPEQNFPRLPEHQNTRTSEHQNKFSPDYQNTRTSEHQNIRTSEHQNKFSSDYQNTRTPEHTRTHQNIRTSEHQNTRTPEHQNTRTQNSFFCHKILELSTNRLHLYHKNISWHIQSCTNIWNWTME